MAAERYEPQQQFWSTPEEYLKNERLSSEKHEYRNGQIVAMAGASITHNRLVFNCAASLGPQLRGTACSGFNSDLRVRAPGARSYFYPDMVIVCGEEEFDDDQFDTLVNPVALVEVLSPSTESHDRGDKFAAFRTIESLRDYILISQDTMRVEHFARQDGGAWLLRAYEKPEDSFAFTGAPVTLRVAEVYERVSFDNPQREGGEAQSPAAS
jgi:Uma2 family endonuclease